MILQYATVTGHTLRLGQTPNVSSQISLPTSSENIDYIAVTIVGTDWNSFLDIRGQFWNSPVEIYEMPLTNGKVEIPWEVLRYPDLVHFAIIGETGASGNTRRTRISTNDVIFKVEQGAFSPVTAPAPSQSMFERALQAALTDIDAANSPMPGMTIKGNNGNASANPANLTVAQLLAMIPMLGVSEQGSGSERVATDGAAGVVPAPVAATNDDRKYLRGNGTWSLPTGVRNATETNLTDIPANTEISMDALLAKLGRWYLEIYGLASLNTAANEGKVLTFTSGSLAAKSIEEIIPDGDEVSY